MKKKQFNLSMSLLLITISSAFSQHLTISSGAKIVTSGAIQINCGVSTFTNNGTFANDSGTLIFSAPVTFAGSGVANTKNMTVNHSGTSLLNNHISVTGSLSVSNGNINANNNLTLVSNAAGSAVIAPVATSSNITGKVTVQRYIPLGKRAYRFLTPGVTTDNFISNNWQLATLITGSSTGANGFDATTTGSQSMFTYTNQQAIGSGWAAIPTTNSTNLNVLHGYRILIRGDRNLSLTAASTANMNTAITLSATGTVATGTVQFNSSTSPAVNNTTNVTTNGYSLVGNPYVNTINWNTLTKTGLIGAYYFWDANMGTTSQRGRYVVYSSTTGSNNTASGVNQYIQPGQAFFVKNSSLGTPGSITFNESDKLGTNITNILRTASENLARLELQVYQTSEMALGAYPVDAAVSVFGNSFTNATDDGDVVKLSSGTENISFFNSTLSLAIDARPAVVATDVLQVQLQQFQANKDYTFKCLFSNFDPTSTPFLVDTYLNQYTALATDVPASVAFTTNSQTASYDVNRFKIVFQNNALNNQNFTAENVVVYPNPVTNNQFTISLPSYIIDEISVKISNTLGQTVYQTKAEAQQTIIITPNTVLADGVYFVQLTNQGKSITKKITIQ